MIDKIIGIRRLAWRVQPPKQWRKNKKPQGGDGFDDVLREELDDRTDRRRWKDT